MTVSKEFKKARESLGMRIVEFVEAVNESDPDGKDITYSAYYNWEKGVEPRTWASDKIRAYVATAIPEKIKELEKIK